MPMGPLAPGMYVIIGGIDLDLEKPAYKHIIMHPSPGGGLTSATAEYHSMYGLIHSSWTQEKDRFDWRIIIPANTTATVYIPAKTFSKVAESGQSLDNSSGITFLRMDDGCAVVSLVSGTYNFTSH